MPHTRSVALWAVLLSVCVGGSAFAQAPASSNQPSSFEDALARGEERGTPVLLEFYTVW